MSRKYRLILMILSLIILFVVGWYFYKDFSFIINDFWFTSGLLLLILLSLIDQPHFSKDSSIFVNGVTAALSLLLVSNEDRDLIFWGFLVFVVYLIASSYLLMLQRSDKLERENIGVQFLSRLNRQIGRPEVIFSSFFLWGGIRQFTMNSSEFNALLWFWIIFMILNIPSLANTIEALFTKETYKKNENAVGKIFGVLFFASTFCRKLQVKNAECCTMHFP